ncbi:MAG: disulfide bond formation protein B [Acetobacteraceae bacterium]
MRPPSHRPAAALTLLAALVAMGVALTAQDWGGMVPCALCLVERWPWRLAILLSLLALLLPRQAGRALLWLTVLDLFAGAAIAFVHVGVEWGLWPSPLPECAAPPPGHGTLAQQLAAMPALPSKPCDAPSYLIPHLPVSMAAMDLIAALGVALLLAAALRRGGRGRRR